MEASTTQEEGLRRDLIDSFDTYLEAKVRFEFGKLAPGQHVCMYFACQFFFMFFFFYYE